MASFLTRISNHSISTSDCSLMFYSTVAKWLRLSCITAFITTQLRGSTNLEGMVRYMHNSWTIMDFKSSYIFQNIQPVSDNVWGLQYLMRDMLASMRPFGDLPLILNQSICVTIQWGFPGDRLCKYGDTKQRFWDSLCFHQNIPDYPCDNYEDDSSEKLRSVL